MRKSFKKVIACLLAVLMVTFSVPFSALAASDDYKPNITMRFGTFVEDSEVTDNGGALTSTEWGVKKPTYDFPVLMVPLLIMRAVLIRRPAHLKSIGFILKIQR